MTDMEKETVADEILEETEQEAADESGADRCTGCRESAG